MHFHAVFKTILLNAKMGRKWSKKIELSRPDQSLKHLNVKVCRKVMRSSFCEQPLPAAHGDALLPAKLASPF